MLFSRKALHDVRRLKNPFNLGAGVANTVFTKGLGNIGVAMKASSNSFTQLLSLAFFASIPPTE
jgi:hypothetical protein